MASTSFNPSNSTHYAEITSDNAQVAESNDNLIYDLSLLDSTFWNNQAVSGGGDIRITNAAGDTAYSFELENFNNNGDGTGTGIIFFNSQGLSTSSDTTYRIYVGDSSASLPAPSDTLGAHNVWGSDVEFVSLDGGTSESTSNSHSVSGSNITSGNVDGKIGNATSYDGTQYVEWDFANYQTVFGNADYTNIVWAKVDDVTDQNPLWAAEDGGSASSGDADQWWGLRFISNEINARHDDGGNRNDTKGGSPSDNTWHYCIDRHTEASGYELYLDSSLIDTEADNGDITESNHSIYTGVDGRNNFLTGDIDMVKVISRGVSDSYIQTEYNNQNDPASFWTTGATVALDSPGRIGERNSSGIGIRTSAGIGKTD